MTKDEYDEWFAFLRTHQVLTDIRAVERGTLRPFPYRDRRRVAAPRRRAGVRSGGGRRVHPMRPEPCVVLPFPIDTLKWRLARSQRQSAAPTPPRTDAVRDLRRRVLVLVRRMLVLVRPPEDASEDTRPRHVRRPRRAR